jgi:threonine dehydrogenase-like Zn-dependent dehydrogenase
MHCTVLILTMVDEVCHCHMQTPQITLHATTEQHAILGGGAIPTGYTHLTGGWAGGQAEYLRVPFADLGCLKVLPCFTAMKMDSYRL